MASSILHQFVQVAALMTASASGIAQMQQASTGPAGLRAQAEASASADQSAAQSADQPTDDSAARATALKVREHYGHMTVADFYRNPHLTTAADALDKAETTETWRRMFTVSRVLTAAAQHVRMDQLIDANGEMSLNALDGPIERTVRQSIGHAVKAGKATSVAEIEKHDPLIKDYIDTQLATMTTVSFDNDPPYMEKLKPKLQLRDFFSPRGALISTDASKQTLSKNLETVLRPLPLEKLADPAFASVTNFLKKDAAEQEKREAGIEERWHDVPSAIQTDTFFTDLSQFSKFMQKTGSPVTIGDVLETPGGPHLRLNGNHMATAMNKVNTAAQDYANNQMIKAAKSGVSTYDYLVNPQDETGTVSALKFSDPIVQGVLGQGEFGAAEIPHKAFEGLKELPLSKALKHPTGSAYQAAHLAYIDTFSVRDALINGVKNEPVNKQPIGFLQMVAPEAASVAIGLSYHPGDAAKLALMTNTTMSAFLSGGNERLYDENQAKFGAIYPPEARAADLDQFHGDEGATNPWRVAATVPTSSNGEAAPGSASAGVHPSAARAITLSPLTRVLYSFSLSDNTADKRDNVKDVHSLTAEQQDITRYLAWRIPLGSNLKLDEAPNALPTSLTTDGKWAPKGILFYGADLSNYKVSGLPGDDSAAGVALNALSDSGHQQVDIALHDIGAPSGKRLADRSYASDLQVQQHEFLHGLGESHPHSPMTFIMPGTVNVAGSHRVDVITPDGPQAISTDVTAMSYVPGSRTWITPTPTDIKVLQNTYGVNSVSYAPEIGTTIKLHEGSEKDVIKSRDPLAAWVSTTESYGQTVMVDPKATTSLDLTTIDGKPVDGSSLSLNLSKTTNDLDLSVGKIAFQPMRLAIVGAPIHNAKIASGLLRGTDGDDVLEIKNTGTLAGGKGKDILIGGVGVTDLIGGEGNKTFVMHADQTSAAQTDEIDSYKTGDKIVAPAGTAKVVYSGPAVIDDKGVQTQDPTTAVVHFIGSNNLPLKSVLVTADSPKVLRKQDLDVYASDGKKLDVTDASVTQSAKNAPAKTTTRSPAFATP